MVAEIGALSLILALLFAIFLMVVPVVGIRLRQVDLQKSLKFYASGQFFFVAMSYCCLTICFLRNDFSVVYVLANSSLLLPWFYKLCAVWGGHEGSMLLWVFILSVWMVAVVFFSTQLALDMRVRVMAVMGGLSAGFILFLLSTSNPFLRQFQILNAQGRDLNPLLQDPGFLFHPPMLYMGYVGFAVAFSFAIAALWEGRTNADWFKWTRPWTLAAWCCLTAGITLGSWWAYRELGWGGWWFWDPVENASFMPWLVGTALLHSQAVSEKRQNFKAWTLLLAIMAFSLSLVGTFLVRSGVLTSVHAFAVDPQRGLYILCFLFFIIGGSLLLFAIRAHLLQDKTTTLPVSRESALLLNNVILVVMMLTVLMGTIYPLIIDGLGLGKLSVGAPYFNTVFVPLMLLLLLLMGAGIHLRWQKDHLRNHVYLYLKIACLSFIVPLLIMFIATGSLNVSVLLGLVLAFWVLLSTLKLLVVRCKEQSVLTLSRSFWGMIIAHIGVAASVIGVAVSTGYGLQEDAKMSPGTTLNFAGYEILFVREFSLAGPNYHGTKAQFDVKSKHHKATIYPEKRVYDVAKMPMTESAIDVTAFADVYVALGEPLDDVAWSVRLYYKPLVRWIWGGGFLILMGGLSALSDARYYTSRKKFVNKAEP